MKIAIISTLEEPVPPKKYGGIELVVSHLADGLTEKGHTVYLLASGDSKTKAKLIPIFKHSLRKEEEIIKLNLKDHFKYIAAAKILEEMSKIKVDIIHSHIGWRFAPFSNLFKAPTVITLHGPLDVPHLQYIYKKFADQNYISISNAQRKPLPNLNYVDTVYNGINIKEFEFSKNPKNYLSFLARISPEKGPIQAIMVAKKTKLNLKMAAKIDKVDIDFYNRRVKKLIDGKQIQYIGEIASSQKSGFLKNSIALLAPIQWEEPFGLFMTEAMACGTPVIAFARGSVPELVKDGETGFIINYSEKDIRGNWIIKKTGINGMIEAVKKIISMPKNDYLKMREMCRKHIENNFTVEKMVNKYEEVYSKILKNN
jgi:glycosyltransferase involved in cell wall biosynthesis